MDKEKDIEDFNLEKEAPLLNSVPKSSPFMVPDGYFDALPSQIMAKCRESVKSTSSAVADKIFWLFRPQWMIASFIIIVGLGLFLRKGGNTPVNYETIAASIPDSVIVQNLQNNIDNVDLASLEEISQAQGNIGTFQVPQASQDTTNGQIINYLINNNIDASDIENAL